MDTPSLPIDALSVTPFRECPSAQRHHRAAPLPPAQCAKIPVHRDGAGGSGIRWKTPIPLPGHNSPVVWRDRIFLSGANWENRQVYCIDAASGSILWTGEVPTAPMGDNWPNVMEDTGLAASTMATDGVRVYAVFATGDLGAFDFDGRLLWHKNLGIPDNTYGHATSLEVWQDRVLVQYDQGFEEDGKSRNLL